MPEFTLKPLPLTRERFAPYGDVIETSSDQSNVMNDLRFERFHDLCKVDFDKGGRPCISIARCKSPSTLPYRIDIVERHPLGSQAFMPLTPCQMIIVVAPPLASVESSDLVAFVTNGRQGINYHRGTWHMPLIAFEPGQQFLIVDYTGDEPNCDVHSLDEAVTLLEA
jgi:ureidoglycolate lyase